MIYLNIQHFAQRSMLAISAQGMVNVIWTLLFIEARVNRLGQRKHMEGVSDSCCNKN